MDDIFERRDESAITGNRPAFHRRWMSILVNIAVAFLCASQAQAQSANSQISVEIEGRSLSVRNLQGLDFGTFLTYGRTGTIVLLPNGTLQANNVHLVDPTAVRLSSWEITGMPGAAYSVTLPGVGNVVANGISMSISPFVRSGPAQLVLDAAGSDRLTIGGYLNIPPYIEPGRYTGTFTITVNYN